MTVQEVIDRAGARWPHAYGEETLVPIVAQADNLLRTMPHCQCNIIVDYYLRGRKKF